MTPAVPCCTIKAFLLIGAYMMVWMFGAILNNTIVYIVTVTKYFKCMYSFYDYEGQIRVLSNS